MHTVFPTEELRDEAVEKYHAIEGGQQTLGNLAAYLTEIVRRELRTDGRERVLQRVDVAGRVHRARGAQRRPGCAALDGAVDRTAAVDLPAAVLPGEPEARPGRRGRP